MVVFKIIFCKENLISVNRVGISITLQNSCLKISFLGRTLDTINNYEEYTNLNVPVIGISKDSVRSHSNFAQKHELPFILLSDENQDVIKAYDVLKEKKLYGKTYMGVVRTTFLISEDFHIMKVFEKVKPEENALEILACL